METLVLYKNRKIYSKSDKKYLNYDDIVLKLKQGVDITVTKKDTGEDVTRKVLNRAIGETESLSVETIYSIL